MSEDTWQKVENRRKLKEIVVSATTRQQKKQAEDQYRAKDKDVKTSCIQDKRNCK